MSKTVLVTGGAGFIGSHACKALAAAGYNPIVYDDLSTGHREFVKWGPLICGDVRDQQRLESAFALFKPIAVMHFAAKSLVGESFQHPDLYHGVNVVGTAALVQAMARGGCENLVLSSSCAVYGNAHSDLIHEGQPFAPISPYGESKARAERIAYSASGVRTIALRYFNPSGGDPDGEIFEWHEPETHLIPIVLDVAAGIRTELSVFGREHPTPDGTPIRDYVHVLDIADAQVEAARYLIDGGRSLALNLGTGTGHSVLDVVQAAERVTGRRVDLVNAPARAGDPASLRADPSYARRMLGWQAKRQSLDAIIRDAWRRRGAHGRVAA
jgi:UDP-arabinose 4-epimerase